MGVGEQEMDRLVCFYFDLVAEGADPGPGVDDDELVSTSYFQTRGVPPIAHILGAGDGVGTPCSPKLNVGVVGGGDGVVAVGLDYLLARLDGEGIGRERPFKKLGEECVYSVRFGRFYKEIVGPLFDRSVVVLDHHMEGGDDHSHRPKAGLPLNRFEDLYRVDVGHHEIDDEEAWLE